MEDVSLLKMNRAYEPQDPARWINWRQLAGGGCLTTNVYETMLPRVITFILDFASFREEAEDPEDASGKYKQVTEEDLERMLSLIASCVLSLTDNHASCKIAFPEMPGAEAHSAEDLLSQLAAVEYGGEDLYYSHGDAAGLQMKSGIKLLIARDWESFTGKEVFKEGNDTIFLAMNRKEEENDCPWRQMFAEEFICSSGEIG